MDERIRVVFGGETIADTKRAKRVLETSHPPVYYLPPEDIAMEHLEASNRTSMCEWKGRARYYTVAAGGQRTEQAAWAYPDPTDRFASMQNYIAFYPSQMDECWIGDEQAEAQEGDFYGGWITAKVVGPFKGRPGTLGW